MERLGDFATWMTTALARLEEDVAGGRSLVRDAMAKLFATFDELRRHLSDDRAVYEGAVRAITGAGNDGGLAQAMRAVLSRFIDDILRISANSAKIQSEVETLRQHAGLVAKRGDRIETIAQTTRVISLNARIEAHRAGRAGAVFQVVADEIKTLANESSELSKAIRQAIALQDHSLNETAEAAQQVVDGDLEYVTTSRRELDEMIERLASVGNASTSALERIQADLDSAVQALQFEDMMDQLLGALGTKLDAIRSVCALAAKGGDLSGLEAALRDAHASIFRTVVTQRSVDSGSVELF